MSKGIISNEAVKAAAEQLVRIVRPSHPNWDEWTADGQEMFKSQARLILEAAEPYMLAAARRDDDCDRDIDGGYAETFADRMAGRSIRAVNHESWREKH